MQRQHHRLGMHRGGLGSLPVQLEERTRRVGSNVSAKITEVSLVCYKESLVERSMRKEDSGDDLYVCAE